MRVTKVVTKTGDNGETGLGNGERVSKDSLRVHAMGAIDELNSFLGWARTVSKDLSYDQLGKIQQDLFNIGGELSIPEVEMNLLKNSRITWLEQSTYEYNQMLSPMKEFILPGGTELSSRLHIVRAECRSAERKIVSLSKVEYVPKEHLKYLNRLSDYLFTLARIDMKKSGTSELSWDYKK